MGDKKDFQVLVVDDEKIIRDLIVNLLKLKQIGADAVGDGEQALERVKEKHYDLFLLDARMPVMDGLTLFGELKVRFPASKYVLITGYDTEEVLTRFKAEKVDFILSKPFNADKFFAVIKGLGFAID